MLIEDHAQVAMWAPQGRFTFVRSPFFVWTDFPWQSSPSMWDSNDDVVSDPDIEAIYPKPLRVPVHFDITPRSANYESVRNSLTSGAAQYYYRSTLATLMWKPTTNNTLDLSNAFIAQMNPLYGQTQDLDLGMELRIFDQLTKDTKVFEIEAEPEECTGFALYICHYGQQQTETAGGGLVVTTNPNAERSIRYGVVIGKDEDAIEYEVRYEANADAGIYRKQSGETDFTLVKRVPGGGEPVHEQGPAVSFKAPFGTGGGTLLDFRLVAGRLMIRVGDLETPYLVEEARVDANNQPITEISKLRIHGEKFGGLAVHFAYQRWPNSASFISTEIPIGFYSEAFAGLHADAAGPIPSGWDVALDTANSELTGPIVTYKMDFVGPNDGSWKGVQYANAPLAIRAVTLAWAKQTSGLPFAPMYAGPEAVSVRHVFNPDTLEINSFVECEFNNNRPVSLPTGEYGFWGEWMAAYGQVALEIALQRTVVSGGYLSGPVLAFSGYGHTSGEVDAEAGASRFTMHGMDRSIQLQDPRFALPWMDGWNSFYAMAYLAQLGGVDTTDLAFRDLVPLVPFGPGSDLGNGEGGPAWYLPVGEGGSVLTRLSGANLWEIMGRIAYAIGYMRFFDIDGRLQFRKFRVPPGTKRAFFESDRESAGAEGCWNIQSYKDMSFVRSDAIVVGIDAYAPRWAPVAAKYSDEGVVYNPRQFNHLGYRSHSVQIDSQFADPWFCDASAFEAIRFLRYPGFGVRISTWLQPDIYPLDVIMVQSRRAGTAWTRMVVMEVLHRKSQDGPGASVIAARFIPA